jgi:hypothetical protein
MVVPPELSDKQGQQGTAGLDPPVASAPLTELTKRGRRNRKADRKQQLKSEETDLGNRSLNSSRSATNQITLRLLPLNCLRR